jgi:hypothetical protein
MGRYMVIQSPDIYRARWKLKLPRDAGNGLLPGSLFSPILFSLTCDKMLKELPAGCRYMDHCTWTTSFENLGDNNELASKVSRF